MPSRGRGRAQRNDRKSARLKVLACVFLLLAVPAVWRWTPLNQWVNFETVSHFLEAVRNYPSAFLWVLAIYLVATFILFPMTMLSVVTVLTFGPITGNIYAMAGWLLSSAIGYVLGRMMGANLLHRIAGPRLERLIHRVEDHGFITVLTVRLLPLAPFTLANLFLGASGICFRDFVAASVVGRIPGIIVLSAVGMQLENALRDPTVESVILLVLALIFAPLLTFWISKRLTSGRRHLAKT